MVPRGGCCQSLEMVEAKGLPLEISFRIYGASLGGGHVFSPPFNCHKYDLWLAHLIGIIFIISATGNSIAFASHPPQLTQNCRRLYCLASPHPLSFPSLHRSFVDSSAAATSWGNYSSVMQSPLPARIHCDPQWHRNVRSACRELRGTQDVRRRRRSWQPPPENLETTAEGLVPPTPSSQQLGSPLPQIVEGFEFPSVAGSAQRRRAK